jgi:hypothetical protein
MKSEYESEEGKDKIQTNINNLINLKQFLYLSLLLGTDPSPWLRGPDRLDCVRTLFPISIVGVWQFPFFGPQCVSSSFPQ